MRQGQKALFHPSLGQVRLPIGFLLDPPCRLGLLRGCQRFSLILLWDKVGYRYGSWALNVGPFMPFRYVPSGGDLEVGPRRTRTFTAWLSQADCAYIMPLLCQVYAITVAQILTRSETISGVANKIRQCILGALCTYKKANSVCSCIISFIYRGTFQVFLGRS